MQQAQVLTYGIDGVLAERLRELAQTRRFWLRETSQLPACQNLLQTSPPSVFVLVLGHGYPAASSAFWYQLALTSTLAGNLTLVGSVANLIVAEAAAKEGVHVGFGAYLKVGVPLTLLTTAAGLLVLWALGYA